MCNRQSQRNEQQFTINLAFESFAVQQQKQRLAYSGNISPASIRMYLSYTPTSMQFMPISPSPPTGKILSGGPSPGGGPGKGLFGCRSKAEPRCSLPSLWMKSLFRLRLPGCRARRFSTTKNKSLMRTAASNTIDCL